MSQLALELIGWNDPQGAVDSEVRVDWTVRTIGREAWDACFEGEVEGYDCLLAIEDAGIDGLEWRYLTVHEGGRIISAVPAFLP